MNIELCMICPLSQRHCAGKCPCTVDGRDIIDHATAGDCPKGYFAEPEKMPPRAPPPVSRLGIPLAGDVVEAIAKAIGADKLARWWSKATGKPCGCADRKAKLNAASARLLKWVERKTR